MEKFTEEEIAAAACVESAECVVNGVDPIDFINPDHLACNLIDAITNSLNLKELSAGDAIAYLFKSEAKLLFFEPVGDYQALEGCDFYGKCEDGNGFYITIEDDEEYGINFRYAIIPAIAMPILETAFKMRCANG